MVTEESHIYVISELVLIEYMPNEMSPKTLVDLQMMLADLLAGDESVFSRPELQTINPESIKIALDFLLKNPMLNDSQRADLLTNSWRINYRDKPPTPAEFITERYLGRAAEHTYDRVKRVFVDFMDPTKPYRNLILYPHIGWGKELRNDCLVKTPTGNIEIGSIRVGDKVCSPTGQTSTVVAVFPQGKKPLYKIIFSDGRSTIAGEPHQWKAAKTTDRSVWDKKQRKYISTQYPEPCWKIIETGQILFDIEKNPTHRWFIPMPVAVHHEKRRHIIPPYTFGALLGDGSLGKNALGICGNDKEIFDRIEAELPDHLMIRYSQTENRTASYSGIIRNKEPYKDNCYRLDLERLGLRDVSSAEKFIPEEYLYDSIENRIALLQGLMDTDGYPGRNSNNRSHPTFTTISEKLRDNIITLIRGLGGQARWSKSEPRNPEFKKKHTLYDVYFTFPENSFPIFGLARKQAIVDLDFDSPRKKRKPQYLYIKEIYKVEDAEATCITVNDPEHLFLCDDYIVTHNSYLATLVNIYTGVHLSMMRNPYKYFGLNPATILCQLLVSYSLRKSSELLLEPLLAILESSPFFGKVHTREGMIKRDQEYERSSSIDKIYWTTAVPTSAIQFSNGANFKLVSSVHNLLGLSVVTGTMSELAFFREAGKALEVSTPILLPDGSTKPIGELQVGDEIAHPTLGKTEVISIPWESDSDDIYCITLDDGRTVECNAEHKWKVSYRVDPITKEKIWEVVTTQFMIDHPELDFELPEIFISKETITQ